MISLRPIRVCGSIFLTVLWSLVIGNRVSSGHGTLRVYAGASAISPASFAAQGAATNHWAFRPITEQRIPSVRDSAWARTPIDRFVKVRLEAAALEPTSQAPRRTLIRRASFGLLGLPPAPEEIEAFESDSAPDSEAFSRVVDRLLASPRYGERWARHWLDVARYADNKGYVFFEEKTHPWAWTYRDYVVRSFNENKPYDRFIVEQIAADLGGPGADAKSLAALGFLTVGDHFSNNTHDIIDDRIDVMMRGIMGLTVACARCHDHKYDPVKTTDYYGFYGIFRGTQEPMAPPLIQNPRPTEAYEGYELELIRREGALRDFVESKHAEIRKGAFSRIREYLLAVHAQRDQPPAENFMLISDKGDLNPAVVQRWRAYLDRRDLVDPVWGLWHTFSKLDETRFESEGTLILSAMKPSQSGVGTEPTLAGSRGRSKVNPLILQAFEKSPPRSMSDVASLYAGALQAVELGSHHAIDAPEKTIESSFDKGRRAAEHELRAVLHGSEAPPDVPLQLDWGFLSLLPDRASQGEFQKLLTSFEQWLIHEPEAPPRAMILRDLPTPYDARVFLRGNPNRPGDPAPRRFLQFLDPASRPFSKGSGRLELAQSLVDISNPLTARVFVNRLWMHHFGNGLVSTPSDFGLRGADPTHPQLLDWLAHDFIRGGYDVKSLHRLLLNSAVYQQSSAPTPRSIGVDPDNRLLSRFPLQRHSFETQRDALLAVSGNLDLKTGGPPAGSDSRRRTLYGFVNRMDVPPEMTTFDFPSPSTSCPQRSATTVAPQALYLMNNEFVMQCASAMLQGANFGITPGNDISEKVQIVFQRVLGRSPAENDIRNARSFLGTDPSRERWEHYVHALLLTNEFGFTD